MSFWNITCLQVGDYFSKMFILMLKTFFLMVLSLFSHELWREREKRIWELRFCFSEMARFSQSKVLVLAEGGGCFNVLLWENLRSYKTSTVNSYTCHLDSLIVNIFSIFALWFSVFAEWPQTLETDTIILFYL